MTFPCVFTEKFLLFFHRYLRADEKMRVVASVLAFWCCSTLRGVLSGIRRASAWLRPPSISAWLVRSTGRDPAESLENFTYSHS